MGVFCSVDDVAGRVYLKPGIWISLILHLALFAFLFFYGGQKLRQQDSFVALAEFNLEQAIKEVDMSAASSAKNNNKSATHASRSAPAQATHQLTPDQPVSEPPATQQKSQLVNTQAASHVNSSSNLVADEHGLTSENNGWLNAKEKSPPAPPSAPTAAAETKKVVIAAHSSTESGGEEGLTGWGAYGRQLSIEAAKMKKYPMLAISSGMQGTVLVSVSVSQSGDVVVGLKRSSGYDLLDEQAVTMVRKAAKNIAIPSDLRNTSKELFVPIQFSL